MVVSGNVEVLHEWSQFSRSAPPRVVPRYIRPLAIYEDTRRKMKISNPQTQGKRVLTISRIKTDAFSGKRNNSFSTHVFRRLRRKMLTNNSLFVLYSPLKNFVLPLCGLQLKIFLTFGADDTKKQRMKIFSREFFASGGEICKYDNILQFCKATYISANFNIVQSNFGISLYF
jgi:hypothetical protein